MKLSRNLIKKKDDRISHLRPERIKNIISNRVATLLDLLDFKVVPKKKYTISDLAPQPNKIRFFLSSHSMYWPHFHPIQTNQIQFISKGSGALGRILQKMAIFGKKFWKFFLSTRVLHVFKSVDAIKKITHPSILTKLWYL